MKSDDNDDEYSYWFFRKKGTAVELPPTAEEMWNDPAVQEIIKHHNVMVEKREGLLTAKALNDEEI